MRGVRGDDVVGRYLDAGIRWFELPDELEAKA